nr:DUF1801 domain-containing protein [Microbacterium endophyticum]
MVCHDRITPGSDRLDNQVPTVDDIIDQLEDWRGDVLARVRGLIKDAEPGVLEETKWQKPTNPLGVATWSVEGIICTGETYKDKVKFTFAKGASLDDPENVFNASLDANVRRAIDVRAGEEIDAPAFQALVQAAAALNRSTRS